jgi:apolipoprotein D and lipocalin family protein
MRILAAAFATAIWLAAGCRTHPPLDTVPHVDLQRYSGQWFEIAHLPASFQRGCFASTAVYTPLSNGKVRVINTCRDKSFSGDERRVEGTARVADPRTNAKLKVTFFWPFEGDYWILALGDQPDYGYALVGTPDREYLWILSRVSPMDAGTYERLVAIARKLGFDVSRLERTPQPGG